MDNDNGSVQTNAQEPLQQAAVAATPESEAAAAAAKVAAMEQGPHPPRPVIGPPVSCHVTWRFNFLKIPDFMTS
jgi:hypothetical protein